MKRRTRINYTPEQKAIIWDRYKQGASAGYAAGNIIKVPMDKILNPVSKQYEWVPTGVWTITKPAPQSSIPSNTGNLGDNFVSGVTGDALQKAVSGDKK